MENRFTPEMPISTIIHGSWDIDPRVKELFCNTLGVLERKGINNLGALRDTPENTLRDVLGVPAPHTSDHLDLALTLRHCATLNLALDNRG